MKNILFRLLVAAALTLAALALSSSTHGQRADEDAAPSNRTSQGKTLQSPSASNAQPSPGD